MILWSGPKAAVLRGCNLSMYGLNVEMRTAVYLGEIPGEVPRIPPYERDLADVIDGALYITSGLLINQRFQIVTGVRAAS